MSAANAQQSIEAAERLVDLRREIPVPVRDLCRRVKDVVVLASSSRGGSSVVAEILRKSHHLLHFRAEVNLFFQLSGYGWPRSGTSSDELLAEHLRDTGTLQTLLAGDVGRPANTLPDAVSVDAFATELWWRLSAQWPAERFDAGRIHDWTRSVLTELRAEHGWGARRFEDPQLFHVLFLSRVSAAHAGVSPWYYDIRPDLIRKHCPSARCCEQPPSSLVLEEPPFVTIRPWLPVGEDDLDLPLLIKTPSNVYRLSFIRALFPAARMRVLHLTRNAAASINGLYDGWRFRGFFAHHVPGALDLESYSDQFPEWGNDWWKFDLPPGWPAWTRGPLVETCGFQWRAAHRAILDYLEQEEVDSTRVRFEDLVAPLPRRRRAFEHVAHWLGIPIDDALQRLIETGLPPIMATSRPRLRRWFDKADLLEPVVQRRDTLDVMERLGYDLDPSTWL